MITDHAATIFTFPMIVFTFQGCIDGTVQHAIVSTVHDTIMSSVVGRSAVTGIDADTETGICRHISGGITTDRR